MHCNLRPPAPPVVCGFDHAVHNAPAHQISAKSDHPRLSCCDLTHFSGPLFNGGVETVAQFSQGWIDQSVPSTDIIHRPIIFTTAVCFTFSTQLLHFETKATQRQFWSKIEAKFGRLHPCKITKGWAKCLNHSCLITNQWHHYTFHGPLRGRID